jgi:hypothetical protein
VRKADQSFLTWLKFLEEVVKSVFWLVGACLRFPVSLYAATGFLDFLRMTMDVERLFVASSLIDRGGKGRTMSVADPP